LAAARPQNRQSYSRLMALVGASAPGGSWGMRRSARKKAINQLGPGDVLLGVADAQSETSQADTPVEVFDPRVAAMFRFMLMDRYAPDSGVTIGDTGIPTKTLYESIAQRHASGVESTLATIVASAVAHAAHELREPRLAAQIALEGVMAAMRYPKYADTRREQGDDFGLYDS
jgi:hypothetical protein